MIYLQLIIEFFKIGLFSFGGGYATIPFLFEISSKYGWYSIEELKQMIAVATITPGPVGINVATYTGLKTAGIMGSIFATIFETLPSLILVIILAKILKKFSDNFIVKSIVATLKPIGCALLVSVAMELIKPSILDIKSMMLLIILLLLSWKSKKDPLFYMLISGIIGVFIVFVS